MIRNLKAMGLALVALFALSAVAASAASAEEEPTNGMLTADGPFYLLGTDEKESPTVGNHLTYPGLESVTCPESHYTVEAVGGGAIENGAETVTVTPAYTNCVSGTLPATVTMNGCDYVFHLGETYEENTGYTVTADLECPDEKDVVVEVYSGTGEGIKLCTVTFKEQTGLQGTEEHPVHIDEVETNELRVTGTFGGIKASKSGIGCGAGSTEAAEYDVDVTLTGYESEELEETHVSLSH